jgi:hypothetical protein
MSQDIKKIAVFSYKKNSTGEGKAAFTDIVWADTQDAHNPLMAKKSRNQLVPVEKTPDPPITNGPCQLPTPQQPLPEGDEQA